MSSFQNLLLNKINQATPLLLRCQSGTGLSNSLLHGTEFQFCFLVTELNICCTSVCTVYMEEGKENWQNIDDAFQWLRRCTHEAGDSVLFAPGLRCIFLSRLHWHDWAINPVYFALLHTGVLEWLPTHYPEKKLCSRGSHGTNSCRWSMLYDWSPLSAGIGYLSQRSFLWQFLRILFWYLEFYISDMQEDVAEKKLPSLWMICCVSDSIPFKLYLLYWIIWQLFCGCFGDFFSPSVLESVRHCKSSRNFGFVDCAFLYMPYFQICVTLIVYFHVL